jgi:hypothetical protein
MNDQIRAEFEKEFPTPEHVFWNGESGTYDSLPAYRFLSDAQQLRWQGYKAAAQAQAGDEVYIRIYDDGNNGWCGAEDKNGKSVQIEKKLDGCYLLFGPLYTHPPAQPQVPEPLPMEPFATIDKDSKNYRAGWNACRQVMLTASQEQEYTQ